MGKVKLMVKKKDQFTGTVGSLSEHQSQVLDAVRKHLISKNIHDTRYDDWMLLRFCRVKNFKLQDITKMIDNEIQYRIDEDIENLLNYDFSRVDEFEDKFYKHGYSGISEEGMPVNIEKMTTFDVKRMLEMTTFKDVEKAVCRNQEEVLNIVFPICSQLANKRIDKQITIYDLKDANYGPLIMNSDARKIFAKGADTSDHYYPETVHQIWVVNAPFMFSAVWSFVKLVLNEKSANKIKVYGSKYQKDLHQIIDPDQLPDFLGGTQTSFPKEDIPWAKYRQYCTDKKTFYPLTNCRISDPEEIAQRNCMLPDYIE